MDMETAPPHHLTHLVNQQCSPPPLNTATFLLPPLSLHRRSIAPCEHRRAWKRRRLKPPTFRNSRSDIEGSRKKQNQSIKTITASTFFKKPDFFLKEEDPEIPSSIQKNTSSAPESSGDSSMWLFKKPLSELVLEECSEAFKEALAAPVRERSVRRYVRFFTQDLNEDFYLRLRLMDNSLVTESGLKIGDTVEGWGYRHDGGEDYVACTLGFRRRKSWNFTYGSSSSPRKRNSPWNEDPGKKWRGIIRKHTGQSLTATSSERNGLNCSPAIQESEEVHVEDRFDGTNVHKWHWAETNCLDWSRKFLEHLLCDKTLLSGEGNLHIKINKVEKFEGEAYVNVRKGKIIPRYELSLVVSYQAEARDSDGKLVLLKTEGFVEVPYISDENAGEDPDVRITIKDDGPIGKTLKAAFVTKGKPFVFEKIREYVDAMAKGGPAKDGVAHSKSEDDSSGLEEDAPKRLLLLQKMGMQLPRRKNPLVCFSNEPILLS